MTVLEELLLAAERLAEAVDDIKEIDRFSPPRSIEFDDIEAMRSLARALRDYRRAQQRELSARAIRGVNGASSVSCGDNDAAPAAPIHDRPAARGHI